MLFSVSCLVLSLPSHSLRCSLFSQLFPVQPFFFLHICTPLFWQFCFRATFGSTFCHVPFFLISPSDFSDDFFFFPRFLLLVAFMVRLFDSASLIRGATYRSGCHASRRAAFHFAAQPSGAAVGHSYSPHP